MVSKYACDHEQRRMLPSGQIEGCRDCGAVLGGEAASMEARLVSLHDQTRFVAGMVASLLVEAERGGDERLAGWLREASERALALGASVWEAREALRALRPEVVEGEDDWFLPT